MANRDAPMGLRPSYHLTGGVIRPNKNYTIASAYNTAIGYGDPVVALSTGSVGPNIAVGTAATAPFVGVFAGCTYQNTAGDMIYSRQWVASTATLGSVDARALVYDDPMIVYEIQADTGTTVAVTDIWNHADITDTGPNTSIGMSRRELDGSDIGTGVNLHIMGMVDSPENAIGEHVNLYVLINEHALRNGGAVSAVNLA